MWDPKKVCTIESSLIDVALRARFRPRTFKSNAELVQKTNQKTAFIFDIQQGNFKIPKILSLVYLLEHAALLVQEARNHESQQDESPLVAAEVAAAQ